ncbi:serine hydrolase domain-containing protein [Microbacterium testaceum]|uniref:serine hydrolase domain-containing protein n=1 Tax=Microbacterium testaceum TaxID=2033 RepID=UPI003429689F
MTDDARPSDSATVLPRGYTHPAYAGVADAFARVIEMDAAGTALSVVVDGETVVDLWGGTDPLSGGDWVRDSATLAFSAAKGMIALLAAQQVQAGALDPLAPVARYWPEFAASGKGEITVADVLTHVAGMPTLPLEAPEDLLDPATLAARVASRAPDFAPRSARVYHVLSYGTIAAEILRRVTGTDAATLLREKVADPLGAALWLGLPASEDHRFLPALMEPIVPPPAPAGTPEASGTACAAAYRSTLQIVPLFERIDGRLGAEPVNGTAFRRAPVPGGGLVADARSLARAYGACVAPVDGVRLLDDETVARVSRDWQDGIREPVCLPGAAPTERWGLGFEISHPLNRMLGDGSFGHSGMGGRLAFAHAPSRTGFAFVGQRMTFPAPGQDPRWALLLEALARV